MTYTMGLKPAVKSKLKDIVSKLKHIEYVCEEVIWQVDEEKEEVDKV